MKSEIEADVQFHELTVIRIGVNSRIWSNHFFSSGVRGFVRFKVCWKLLLEV